jgi:flagellar L-ring protein precursor FlgH
MRKLYQAIVVAGITLCLADAEAGKPKKESTPMLPTSLPQFLARVQGQPVVATNSLGSLWPLQGSQLTDLAIDYKARHLNDIVIIRIVEQTLAQASGAVTAQRGFAASSAITAVAGAANTASLNPLYNVNSNSNLKGTGTANSQSLLQATLAGRVVAVLPNGYLVVECERQVSFNQQTQTVILRGLVRPGDILGDDSVLSTALSDLELELKGKGVVSDSVRQPNLFMRLLMKIAAF